MLEVRNLSKLYQRKPVLQEVSFTLEPGQCVGVAGHNGSGKSTLLAIVAQTLPSDGGDILFDGVSLAGNRTLAGAVLGYVPQDDSLLDDLTVQETLSFWQKVYGLQTGKLFTPSSPATMLGLEEIRKKRIARLSGGMRKRVSIAIALLRQPRLLLLDEALSALDRGHRLALEAYMRELCTQGGCILCCSHEITGLAAVCRRVMVLRQGRKVFDGDVETFPTDGDVLDSLLNDIDLPAQS